MIKIVDDIRDVDIYLNLRDKVDWIKLTRPQAQRALDNSVKVFTVLDDDKPIGMGRVVGDEAVISYIQDLIVIPEYQSRHIGSLLIEHIIEYVKSLTALCVRRAESSFMRSITLLQDLQMHLVRV